MTYLAPQQILEIELRIR